MSEVAQAIKPLFDKFIDFFDIFDLSFFVSGATFVAAVAWVGLTPDLAQLIGFAPLDSGAWLVPGQVPAISAVILILASYVAGMTCFALGRWVRSWVFRVLHWARGVPRRKQTMLFDELEQHGVLERLPDGVRFRVRPEFDRLPWLQRYFIDGGIGQESALYVRMWAEVRQLVRFAPSFSLVRRYWVASATLDGLFVALLTWSVMLRLETTHIHGWIPSVATLIGALFCLREAQRYGEYQREELVATMLHAYDLPDAELGLMLNLEGLNAKATQAARRATSETRSTIETETEVELGTDPEIDVATLIEARAARVESRVRVAEVDCPTCEARGFRYFEAKNDAGETREMFQWCDDCRHSGRVHQCRDSAGYYAVSHAALERFLAGELGEASPGVTFLGPQAIQEHRYAQAGEVWDDGASEDDVSRPES